MRFFEISMWQSGRLGLEVPDPKTKESKASDNYVIQYVQYIHHTGSWILSIARVGPWAGSHTIHDWNLWIDRTPRYSCQSASPINTHQYHQTLTNLHKGERKLSESMEDTLFTFDPVKERKNALLAIPKKGRLYERCMKLLEGAGLDHHRPNRLDVAHCTGLPVTIVFLPASDIASCKSPCRRCASLIEEHLVNIAHHTSIRCR